jgi:2,4-dienoyl-CoA reductase-like NADH-dependent reductase (Old Yellow Enzyme family)
MSDLASLFSPFKLKSLTLPNRVVMAPMTRSFSPGGVATAEVAAYYRRRAENEVGLIISEGTGVRRPVSVNDPKVPRFYGEAELAAWKTVIDEVHAAGGLMAPQLWHVGAVKSREKDWTPPGPYDSPSGLAGPGRPFGDAMTDEDIADTIDAFATAAAAAEQLGFDAVELHGAHDRSVFLVGRQRAGRRLWRGYDHGARQVRRRYPKGRAQGGQPRLSRHYPALSVEAAGLRRPYR